MVSLTARQGWGDLAAYGFDWGLRGAYSPKRGRSSTRIDDSTACDYAVPMIERIKWPRPKRDELESPFLRGKDERPLRLTLHSSTLAAPPSDEAEALEALRDLAHHPLLDIVQTEAGELPLLTVDANYNLPDEYLVAIVQQGEWRRPGYIRNREEWPAIAAHLVGQADPQHPDARAMLNDLLVAQMHVAVRHDLFVTMSPWLLERRGHEVVLDVNPRRPSEAARIVGLFLRSRDDYGKYQVDEPPRPPFTAVGGAYYEVLARHRLPSMWLYTSACAHARRARPGDDIHDLAKSVITRCARALEARDAIGEQFYIPGYTSVLDRILYHFDYLSLLLVGAFDAQARIAHRAYNITRPGARQAGFQRDDFQRALRTAGVSDLCTLVTGRRFGDVLTLLHELRTTIHGVALDGVLSGHAAQFNAVQLLVPPASTQLVWDAATKCGSPSCWGLSRRELFGPDGARHVEVWLEPYTYATTLVEECFGLIDAVAAKTDVLRLLPPGYPVAELDDKPRERGLFKEAIRRRLAVLG